MNKTNFQIFVAPKAEKDNWFQLKSRVTYDGKPPSEIINDGPTHTDRAMAITGIYFEKDLRPVWEANLMMLKVFNWGPLKGRFLEKKIICSYL